MKKIITVIISIAIIAFIALTLYGNKQEMKEKAKLAEISSEAIPVKVTSIQKRQQQNFVRADGVFEANTDLEILSETSGEVTRVYKEKGSKVKKGELLAEIENASVESELIAMEANLNKARTDLKRFTKLAEENAVTKRQLEDVKVNLKNVEAQFRSAKKRMENTYIRSTSTGSINNDYVQEGSFISVGKVLYEIVDANTLKLPVKLSAREVLKLQEGQLVEVRTQVYPTEIFRGKVISIASKADNALKYEVVIEINNQENKPLKPGMYASVDFDFKDTEERYYLDRNALIGSIQNPQVYIIKNEKSILKNIKVGEVNDDMVEVSEGLSTQDVIVLSGHINLTDSTNVKILK